MRRSLLSATSRFRVRPWNRTGHKARPEVNVDEKTQRGNTLANVVDLLRRPLLFGFRECAFGEAMDVTESENLELVKALALHGSRWCQETGRFAREGRDRSPVPEDSTSSPFLRGWRPVSIETSRCPLPTRQKRQSGIHLPLPPCRMRNRKTRSPRSRHPEAVRRETLSAGHRW